MGNKDWTFDGKYGFIVFIIFLLLASTRWIRWNIQKSILRGVADYIGIDVLVIYYVMIGSLLLYIFSRKDFIPTLRRLIYNPDKKKPRTKRRKKK